MELSAEDRAKYFHEGFEACLEIDNVNHRFDAFKETFYKTLIRRAKAVDAYCNDLSGEGVVYRPARRWGFSHILSLLEFQCYVIVVQSRSSSEWLMQSENLKKFVEGECGYRIGSPRKPTEVSA
jgi:hypothetical protein